MPTPRLAARWPPRWLPCGATGQQDEITRIAGGGAVAAPLIVAVGLGETDKGGERGGLESLRRAAGSAVRALTGGSTASAALALPAADAAQAEAVALGALLGRYQFTRYRAAGNGTGTSLSLTMLTGCRRRGGRGRQGRGAGRRHDPGP